MGNEHWRESALELPAQRTTIALDRSFSPGEMARIQAGLLPEVMEDKWFIYWENDTLFFHRSWTGNCIYVVRFTGQGEGYRMIAADVNRDPNQYSETNDTYDAGMISYLIDVLLLHRPGDFPAGDSSAEENALKKWSMVGRAMLGRHPGDGSREEPDHS